MKTYIYILPVISAACGVLIAIFIRKKVLTRVPLLVKELIGPDAFQHIRSPIEMHIDDFLRHKLSKAMPMISLFIGDKTIAQLKTIFMKEMEDMFPVVINRYVDNLSPAIHSTLKKHLRYLPVTGMVAGLLIGIIQLAFIMLFV